MTRDDPVHQMTAAVIFGGPSGERGISMNSARSIVDHLRGGPARVTALIYVDADLCRFRVLPGQLYSNTPLDFDYKRRDLLEELTPEAFAELCTSRDIVIPLIHGAFGEDGTLQRELESLGAPFVGPGSEAAERSYDKGLCHDHLTRAGIGTVPTLKLDDVRDHPPAPGSVAAFAHAPAIVIKPARGGSSLGVEVIDRDPHAAVSDQLTSLANGTRRGPGLLAQPYMRGREVSLVVLEGPSGPVALPPLMIERGESPVGSRIFSYHEKYLPSEHVRFHCPIDEGELTIARLRAQGEAVFSTLGLKDWARIDCWLLDDGGVLVSDVNPVPGAEQNSIIFICGAEAGLSHGDVVLHAVANALHRCGSDLDPRLMQHGTPDSDPAPLRVIFGGDSSERQVSVLSGVNSWLKLRTVPGVRPEPYFLSRDRRVVRLSYSAALRHSVEEIEDYVARPERLHAIARDLGRDVRTRLGPPDEGLPSACGDWMPLDEFLGTPGPVFLGLHGGIGEDGTLQRELEARRIPFNGSPSDVCALCMDKLETARAIIDADIPGVLNRPAIEVAATQLIGTPPDRLWDELTTTLGTSRIVLKPASDGCSTGVLVLSDAGELGRYAHAIRDRVREITGAGFGRHRDDDIISMPARAERFMAERFVETDSLGISGDQDDPILWGEDTDSGWIEITAGIIEIAGRLECLTPSLTVAASGVLSKEEKFMGGTGINFTPPPAPPHGRVPGSAVEHARRALLRVAQTLGVRGYARIDAFMRCDTGEIVVIEANALPALTPSTVLFQQGTARTPPLLPHELLAAIARC